MRQPMDMETMDSQRETVRIGRNLLVLCFCMVLIFASSVLDGPAAQWMRDTGTDAVVRRHWLAKVVKAPGTYWYTLVVAGGLWALHRLKWQACGLMCLSGLAALSNSVGKWIFGRARPFKLVGVMEQPAVYEPHWFIHGWRGLFEQKDLAFPSGHACTAFAAATAAAILLPKWRWAFYACAALVGAERVAENAHYVSDVVAGAALGILGMRLTAWIAAEQVRKHEVRKAAELVKLGVSQANHE